MSAIILDTLEFAAKLKAGGFTEQQAEAQTRAFAEVIEKQLATKGEIEEHESALRRDIEAMRIELKRDIKEAELKLEARMAENKADLTRWIIGAGLLQTSLIAGMLMKVAKLI